MKRWPTKSLGEVAQVTAGDPAPQRPEDFFDDGVPFVRMQDVGRLGQTICLTETKDRLSPSASQKFRRFPVGSILVPKSGASIRLNHRAILGVEAHVVSHLAVILPHPSLDTRFVYYWLCGKDLSKIAHQADLPSMKTSELAKLQLPVPPLGEQQRLVKLLDGADELRKLRAQGDSLTAALIPSLFHEMFGDPDANPHGWPEKLLPDIAFFQEGPGVRKWQFRSDGIKLINVGNIVQGKLDLSKTDRHLDEDEVKKSYSHFLLKAGDLVMATSGVTWGKVAFVEPQHLPLCLNTSVVRFRPLNIDTCHSMFLRAFFETHGFRRQIHQLITGSAQPNFGPSHLKLVRLPVPPLHLQKEFAQQVTQNREMEAGQASSRQRLEALFRSLLHRAFNGDL